MKKNNNNANISKLGLFIMAIIVTGVGILGGIALQKHLQRKKLNREISAILDSRVAKRRVEETRETALEKKQEEFENAEEPMIGMTEWQVRDTEWGRPDSRNDRESAYGTSSQWVYRGYKNKYVYFRDGLVTSISK